MPAILSLKRNLPQTVALFALNRLIMQKSHKIKPPFTSFTHFFRFLKISWHKKNFKLRIADQVLDGGVLLAIDGLWYYSSQEIHCEHCLHRSQAGETTYYHSAVAGAIVRPGSTAVLPVMMEPIRNSDGKEKQDCEYKAGKRWLSAHGKEYQWLKATL